MLTNASLERVFGAETWSGGAQALSALSLQDMLDLLKRIHGMMDRCLCRVRGLETETFNGKEESTAAALAECSRNLCEQLATLCVLHELFVLVVARRLGAERADGGAEPKAERADGGAEPKAERADGGAEPKAERAGAERAERAGGEGGEFADFAGRSFDRNCWSMMLLLRAVEMDALRSVASKLEVMGRRYKLDAEPGMLVLRGHELALADDAVAFPGVVFLSLRVHQIGIAVFLEMHALVRALAARAGAESLGRLPLPLPPPMSPSAIPKQERPQWMLPPSSSLSLSSSSSSSSSSSLSFPSSSSSSLSFPSSSSSSSLSSPSPSLLCSRISGDGLLAFGIRAVEWACAGQPTHWTRWLGEHGVRADFTEAFMAHCGKGGGRWVRFMRWGVSCLHPNLHGDYAHCDSCLVKKRKREE